MEVGGGGCQIRVLYFSPNYVTNQLLVKHIFLSTEIPNFAIFFLSGRFLETTDEYTSLPSDRGRLSRLLFFLVVSSLSLLLVVFLDIAMVWKEKPASVITEIIIIMMTFGDNVLLETRL